jgi:SAM-dependent methyltransferase
MQRLRCVAATQASAVSQAMTRVAPWKRLRLLGLALLLAGGCTSWKQLAYEGWGRDEWQHPERVIEALEIRPGSQVADLGAGSGYFTFHLADAVGKDGVVWAVDVDPDMISLVDELAAEKGATNVRTVLAEPDDPELPDATIDLVFTSNTYHHLDAPTQYFARLRGDLAPDGRVAILDLRPDANWFTRWFGHATPPARIREEMEAAGYELVDEQGFVEQQSFLVFRAADG